MPHQVALLRAVNLGARNRIAMPLLRELVEGLGYADARTHLQSGNVVYRGDDDPQQAARRIEAALAEGAGLDVRVIVRTQKELAAVVERDPMAELATEPRRYFVAFLAEPAPKAALAELEPDGFLPERFSAREREIYVWLPGGMRRARLTQAFWERRLAVAVTLRNWNTVRDLAALMAG